MKNKLRTLGIIAIFSPVPMLLLAILFIWLMAILFHGVLLLPLLAGPIMCCAFIAYGINKRKEPGARICILLSVLGLIENVLLFFLIYYFRYQIVEFIFK
ncbi:MAG: hypothetical protein IJL87_00335 [Clostridia bacterium]|nr:hypothetical protein [Clostridia bacterium]